MIENAHYISLSTTDGLHPWTAPLYFANDENYNLYYVSRKDTLHSKHIYKNPNVSFCIFDTKSTDFSAQGLQASGIAEEVGLKEALKAMTVLYKKKHPTVADLSKIKFNLKEVTGAINNRIYKITPQHVFLLDPKNPDMDTRIEVLLK